MSSPERRYDLFHNVSPDKLPIVYSPHYNISVCGLENLHPFDSKKWGRVYSLLEECGLISMETITEPVEILTEELLAVHTQRYLDSLQSSCTLAAITEVPPVCCLPACINDWLVLQPLRYHTAGTILATKLAMERGWAINIGGGFHHCSADHGGGFCVYADITLAIHFLFHNCDNVTRVMIVDLDAHQGNGYERDFMNDDRVFMMDVFNSQIYPNDTNAKKGIQRAIELKSYTEDEFYLATVARNLEEVLTEFKPDIVVYNAGTDVLDGDTLGLLSISEDGVIKRDEVVFRYVRSKNIPIVMLTSGGYQRRTAQIIARSIMNLNDQRLISCH
jgi:histone deacetylase 11